MLHRRLILSCCLSFLWSARSEAQLHPSVFLVSAYSSNIYGTTAPQSDWITDALFSLDFDLPANTSLSYTGGASVFDQNEDLFSHTHSAGVGYMRLLTDSEVLLLDAEMRTWIDHPSYSYYDYVQGELRLRWVQLEPSWRPDAGYTLRYRTYPRASGYRFTEHLFSGRSEQSIATGLSVEFSSELGRRRYAADATDLSSSPAGDQSQVQMTLSAGVTHEISTDSRLHVSYCWLHDVAGRGSELNEEADTGVDLAVDHYSYEGQKIQASLTQEFAGVGFRGTSKLDIRNYSSRLALDMEGLPLGNGILRSDSRRSLELQVDRSLGIGADERLRLLLKWRYTDVDSNDLFYDASTQLYSTALRFAF